MQPWRSSSFCQLLFVLILLNVKMYGALGSEIQTVWTWKGESAVMSVEYNHQYIQLVWKRDGSTLISCPIVTGGCPPPNGKTEGNVNLVVESSASPRHITGRLTISNVSLGDEGNYSCDATLIGTTADKTLFQLEVWVQPERLDLLDGDSPLPTSQEETTIYLIDGQRPTLIGCRSIGSKPAANLMWYLDGEVISSDDIRDVTSNRRDGRLKDAISWFQIREEHVGKTLLCRATINGMNVGETSVYLVAQEQTSTTISTGDGGDKAPITTTPVPTLCTGANNVSFEVQTEFTTSSSFMIRYSVDHPIPETLCYVHECESSSEPHNFERCPRKLLIELNNNVINDEQYEVTDLDASTTYDIYIICDHTSCGKSKAKQRATTNNPVNDMPEGSGSATASGNVWIRDLIFVIIAVIVVSAFVIVVTVTVVLRAVVRGNTPVAPKTCSDVMVPAYYTQRSNGSLTRSGSTNLYTISEANESDDMYQEIKDRSVTPGIRRSLSVGSHRSITGLNRNSVASHRSSVRYSPQISRYSKPPPLPPTPTASLESPFVFDVVSTDSAKSKTEADPNQGEGEYMRMDSVIIDDIDFTIFAE